MANSTVNTRPFLISMGAYWLFFGGITIFFPAMMDMFHSAAGLSAKTAFSNHLWIHDGFDILAICIFLFALSRENISRNMLRAASLVALMPAIVIFYSVFATTYWSPLFLGAGLGCVAFSVWGFALVAKSGK